MSKPSGSSVHSAVHGTCQFMCPVAERILREREGLLHKFEIQENTGIASRTISTGRRGRTQKLADIQRTIKTFSRSAAGQNKIVQDDLRPAKILEQTVEYLCTQILPKSNEPFPVIYDFVFDRLRAVRQDLVIQRIMDESAIRILETIVRFHIYANYRCQNESISNFDSFINEKHLFDCLKRLLWLYIANDYDYNGTSRLQFETIHLVLSPKPNKIASTLDPNLMKYGPYKTAFQMCLAYQLRNYVQYFRCLKELAKDESNIFLVMCTTSHIKFLRGSGLNAMSIAIGGVKNGGKVPVNWLTDLFLYPGISELETDLKTLGIDAQVVDRQILLFKHLSISNTKPADGNFNSFQSLSSCLSLLESKSLSPTLVGELCSRSFGNISNNLHKNAQNHKTPDSYWDD